MTQIRHPVLPRVYRNSADLLPVTPGERFSVQHIRNVFARKIQINLSILFRLRRIRYIENMFRFEFRFQHGICLQYGIHG